jgi:hypothetical protein
MTRYPALLEAGDVPDEELADVRSLPPDPPTVTMRLLSEASRREVLTLTKDGRAQLVTLMRQIAELPVARATLAQSAIGQVHHILTEIEVRMREVAS